MQDIDAFIEQQYQAGLSGATVKRRVAALKVFFDYLAEETNDVSWSNPVRFKRHAGKQAKKLARDLSDQQVAQLWRVISSVRDRAWFGLMLRAGLRVGEAIRLQIDQVNLDLDPPQLHILETKFHKSRIVPVHPSTADGLRHYHDQRAHLHYDGLSDAFFVSERGDHLNPRALHAWFGRLCQRVDVKPTHGGRAPCLSSFRHTFAVTRMQHWYEQGLDVQALLPHLSVYLGHVHAQESYWYLTSVPELLGAAANRFQAYAQAGGTRHA